VSSVLQTLNLSNWQPIFRRGSLDGIHLIHTELKNQELLITITKNNSKQTSEHYIERARRTLTEKQPETDSMAETAADRRSSSNPEPASDEILSAIQSALQSVPLNPSTFPARSSFEFLAFLGEVIWDLHSRISGSEVQRRDTVLPN
jgi:hypothetical protein